MEPPVASGISGIPTSCSAFYRLPSTNYGAGLEVRSPTPAYRAPMGPRAIGVTGLPGHSTWAWRQNQLTVPDQLVVNWVCRHDLQVRSLAPLPRWLSPRGHVTISCFCLGNPVWTTLFNFEPVNNRSRFAAARPATRHDWRRQMLLRRIKPGDSLPAGGFAQTHATADTTLKALAARAQATVFGVRLFSPTRRWTTWRAVATSMVQSGRISYCGVRHSRTA